MNKQYTTDTLPEEFKFHVEGVDGAEYTARANIGDTYLVSGKDFDPVCYLPFQVVDCLNTGAWIVHNPAKPFSVTIDGVLYHADEDPRLELLLAAMEYLKARAFLEKFKA